MVVVVLVFRSEVKSSLAAQVKRLMAGPFEMEWERQVPQSQTELIAAGGGAGTDGFAAEAIPESAKVVLGRRADIPAAGVTFSGAFGNTEKGSSPGSSSRSVQVSYRQ